ncbi:MAG: 2-oxoacid:acceptor oxidoreductase family protein [Sulfurovaceae bacterium]
MRYQSVIAGFGGQGVVFLVKVLAICAGNRNIPFLGTENHGMSQRGGAVSCHIKIGDFSSPLIDTNQADLLIGLEAQESLRNISFLHKNGKVVTNADTNFPQLPFVTAKADGFALAKQGKFPIQALNVFMLGVVLGSIEDFPFSQEEVRTAIEQMNAKMAQQNFKVLEMGIEAGNRSKN